VRTPGGEITVTSGDTRPTKAVRAKDSLGRYGEDVAARHLVSDGFVVLERNWSCELGELDIIARDGDVLVACEVKTRSSLSHGSPFEAVTERKLHRVQRLALRWLRESGVRPASVRVDVVCVLRPRTGPMVVEHVRGLS
jgi:putative endonuclease